MRIRNTFLIIFLVLVVAIAALRLYLYDRYVVPIIMYHHVEATGDTRSNYVSPQVFRRQMEFLKKNRYRVISLDEFVRGVEEGRRFPHNTVVITFDDGYADNFSAAFPVLAEYDFPATIFVIVNKIGEEGYLTWDQVMVMDNSVITIGSHTLDHSYLPDLESAEKFRQITESKKILERRLNHAVNYFSYPIGGFDEECKQILRQAGYRASCATNRGADRFNKDVFELNRVRLNEKDQSAVVLWMKLSGYYNLFRALKASH